MKPIGREAVPLTERQREIAAEYLDSNIGYKELSDKCGKPVSSIRYWVKKLREERDKKKEG